MLQWGRGFAATEGRNAKGEILARYVLQWGRGFAATEGAGYLKTVPTQT